MADGGLHIEIDEPLAEQIRAAALARGMTPEAYASSMLRSALDDWAETEARFAEYERTGEAYDAEPVLEAFLQKVSQGVAKRS